MTGYLLLALSLIAGATKGFCGKKISTYTNDLFSALKANLLRMLICVVIGFFLTVLNSDTLFPDKNILFTAMLSGLSTACFVVTWLLSVRQNAYVMLELFLTMGVIIPLALSKILFDEAVSLKQVIGFLILAAGVYILSLYNNSLKGKIKLRDLLTLLVCGVSNGITDFSQKLFIKNANHTPVSIFNLYTYVFCAIILALVMIFVDKKKTSYSSSRFSCKVIIYISIMSICLFAHSYFKTTCAGMLDAVKLYPLSQGGSLILSTLMATLFFKEKITAKSIIGTVIAFMGLLTINM